MRIRASKDGTRPKHGPTGISCRKIGEQNRPGAIEKLREMQSQMATTTRMSAQPSRHAWRLKPKRLMR